jgi:hypothetical protein
MGQIPAQVRAAETWREQLEKRYFIYIADIRYYKV